MKFSEINEEVINGIVQLDIEQWKKMMEEYASTLEAQAAHVKKTAEGLTDKDAEELNTGNSNVNDAITDYISISNEMFDIAKSITHSKSSR